eukprot:1960845-Pleurochrysis_carterae.AAC.1
MRLVQLHSVERFVALPAARRDDVGIFVHAPVAAHAPRQAVRGSAGRSTSAPLCMRLCACNASSGAWLIPPLDVVTFVHAPGAHA